jgi:tRNA pseudouridine13 synthase
LQFFGEKLLGVPGLASIVGVMAFDVGRSMLQQSYRDAVNKIMTGRIITRDYANRETDVVLNVRQTWKETGGDPHRTWKVLPRGSAMARERLILKGLTRYGDPLLAIRCLHFHERMFWISAYQSYVWNAMTSERIRRYGTAVVVGDLVEDGDDGQVRIVTAESM